MDMKLVEIKCQGSMELSIDELKPFQGELKELSHESYEKLKAEILRHGFSEPIGVWKHENEWRVLSGHQRLRTLLAMRDEGFKIPKVPVSMIYANDVKDAKEKILALTSQYGEITDQGLYEFMNEANIDLSYLDNLRMPEIDLDKWKDNFVEDTSSRDATEDEVPEPLAEVVSKHGDLYELGSHRLICGDSTDIAQVEKLMNGEKADMVFTDPPYGIDLDTDWSSLQNKDYAKKISKNTTYISDTKKHSKIINDDTILNLGFIFSENYKQIIIFGGNYFAQDIPKEVYSKGSFLVWDKNGGNEDFNKMFGSSFELAFLYPAKKQDIIYRTWRGVFGRGDGSGFLRGKTNALETDKTVHPTQKPVRLWLQIIEQIKLEEGSVFDPFGGSGSTLIACEKTNRKCFMMELDPYYVDVIVSRWCKYTGQTKIKRNGEEIDWILP